MCKAFIRGRYGEIGDSGRGVSIVCVLPRRALRVGGLFDIGSEVLVFLGRYHKVTGICSESLSMELTERPSFVEKVIVPGS